MASRQVRTSTPEALRIALVGKTGCGKSSSGNTILGFNKFVAKPFGKSVTQHCKKVETDIDGRRVEVVDTPGLFDTSMSNEQIMTETSKCINLLCPGPHAFLLLLRIGRFTEEEQRAVECIKRTFGEDAEKYIMIIFTGGDDLEKHKASIEDHIDNSEDSLQKLVSDCGNRFHVFNNWEKKDRAQVKELLWKIDDMVRKNGGSHYTSEMFQEAEEAIQREQSRVLKEKQQEIEKQEEEMRRKCQQEMKKVLEEEKQKQDKEKREMEKKLKEMAYEQQRSKQKQEEEKREMEKKLIEMNEKMKEDQERRKQKQEEERRLKEKQLGEVAEKMKKDQERRKQKKEEEKREMEKRMTEMAEKMKKDQEVRKQKQEEEKREMERKLAEMTEKINEQRRKVFEERQRERQRDREREMERQMEMFRRFAEQIESLVAIYIYITKNQQG